MALGASREQVLTSILRTSLWIAAAGAVAGLALYEAMLRILAAAVGTLPNDPIALLLAVVAILLLSLLAAAPPALRASTIDPIRGLRTE